MSVETLSILDEDKVREALSGVIDPELGDNIVDLGLVYAVLINEGGVVNVLMTTTTRGCPASSYLKDGAREAVAGIPDVRSVEVTLVYDPPWTPDMLSEAARRHLGFA